MGLPAASTGTAAAATETVPASTYSYVNDVRATNKVVLSIETYVSAFTGPQVQLIAKKGNRSTTYQNGGRAGLRRIKAFFPKRGVIDLTFRGNGRRRDVTPDNCSGGRVIERRGVWSGRLIFGGEFGYTTVRRTKIRGAIVNQPELTCPAGNERQPTATLEASRYLDDGTPSLPCEAAKCDDPRLGFTAARFDDGDVYFVASSYEPIGGPSGYFSIYRTVETRRGDFSYNEERTAANVEPGGRFFSGEGFFADPEWTGSLTTRFLGRGRTPLAGEGWSATLD